ncbi:cysteine-rich receptor-like protein kinase 8 [Brachypodium distachyon]|uniref:Protein kinase domain-containing protein n=1 Tax=Brachypodium distachyon TaxID=15368 RepID=A0A0Q3IP54_BRADI|nr:cysteine-rich receptor-like protein kinase 8 [Brachypodium distachyon]KQJ88056.1 hypothetical protein BRADI_4g15047v3 [Brachypodium distachyon]PNT63391.1 hypothetical protein BRADI_4g15047v3 [Brachypodium distachyon]PNT63394.1 hypothetical protein BRADI_4g15047v3 [Brachypodium distachyon]|eukprot:XP_014757376.1 cysteine-rich receptor-like protein kinase 8 [Brachypodium distachyon]
MERAVLSIQIIKNITNGFTDIIGEGSFGVVYKGKYNGKQVAVKKLRESSQLSETDFEKEVQILKLVDHQNIVKLIGYCCQREDPTEQRPSFGSRDVVEKFLCFEYVPNGSLDKCIYGEPSKLGWDKRFKIIKGICKGLDALHGQGRRIIHSDLNPANILLDDNMEPKIADFGLSRIFGENQTHTRITNSKSAMEYMAPEYLQRGQLSIESDIYSLGLLIIEITTGEKNCSDDELYTTDFTEDVRKNWTNMPYIKLKYPALSSDGYRQVEGCIKIGLNCLSKKRKDRPNSANIVHKVDQIGAGSSSVFHRCESSWIYGTK